MDKPHNIRFDSIEIKNLTLAVSQHHGTLTRCFASIMSVRRCFMFHVIQVTFYIQYTEAVQFLIAYNTFTAFSPHTKLLSQHTRSITTHFISILLQGNGLCQKPYKRCIALPRQPILIGAAVCSMQRLLHILWSHSLPGRSLLCHGLNHNMPLQCVLSDTFNLYIYPTRYLP